MIDLQSSPRVPNRRSEPLQSAFALEAVRERLRSRAQQGGGEQPGHGGNFARRPRLSAQSGDLGREARIEAVGLPQQGRPGEQVGAELEARFAHLVGELGRARGGFETLFAARRERLDRASQAPLQE